MAAPCCSKQTLGRGLRPEPLRLAARGSTRQRQRHQPVRAQAPPSGAAAGAFGDEPFPGYGAPQQPAEVPGSDGQASQPQNSSGGDKAASAAGGVPAAGALQAIKNACMAYDRAVKAKPVVTKSLTSFFGFAIGDRIAQSVVGGAYDPWRCARLSLYGLLLDGPVGHLWYKLLDKYVCPDDPTSNKAVLIKTALDQLVWGPLMTLVFFAFLKSLEGHPELILATIKDKFWPTMLANYVVWPLAHVFNFKVIPTDYRILFNNVVAIGWTSYLSFLCGGPAGGHGASAALGGPGDAAAAAAASALLSSLPCHKVPDALSHPEVAEAARQVAAVEHIIAAFGKQSLPSTDVLINYWHMKAEVMQSVCQQPIRLPPS